MAKNKAPLGLPPIAWVAIVAILAISMGWIANPFGQQATIATPDEAGNIPVLECQSTTTPTLTIRAYDVDNVGTALTEATNIYREKGATAWTAFTQGTGFTNVDPGDELEIVMGISASDFVDNAYGSYFTYTVPCEEAPSLDKAVANDEIETELTATFYNADGNAGAETFSTGETQTVSIKLKAGTDQSFGNPFIGGNTNVLCLNLNSSEWDKPEQIYLADGSELSSVSAPQRHASVASMIPYCYEAPVVGDKNLEIFLDLNADDSNAPGTDMTAHIYAGNYFINGETGMVEYGVETEEGAVVGTDASDTVTLDFTA